MNRYEERAERQRKATMRFSSMMWSASGVLLVVVAVILLFSTSAPPSYWSRAGIGLAILLLILRQVSRRISNKVPRAAQPDARSTLKLD